MSNMDQTTQMLIILLVGLGVLLFVLIAVYLIIKHKENSVQRNINTDSTRLENIKKEKNKKVGNKSVFDFLEFDKIEDNMIIRDNGKKYIMAIECQGINYDLMSGLEKTGVEESFVQFLNTLRNPIQIYVQTRTINLESSINAYKEKVSQIESELYKKKLQYQEMIDSGLYTENDLNKAFFEITKQSNLYEYGKDIIYDTEKMSLNKNILNKKYYIIISYFSSELGSNEYDKEEIQAMAFSELYTRAQSLIRAISPCSVSGKILNSVELSELLYVAYNRDESETLDLKKAIRAEYDNLYTTAPDVMSKKMKELDKEIEKRAIETARNKVEKFRNKAEVDKKQESIQDIADEMAQIILEQNREYVEEDVINEAINELQKEKIKRRGGKQNEEGQTEKKTRRSTKAK